MGLCILLCFISFCVSWKLIEVHGYDSVQTNIPNSRRKNQLVRILLKRTCKYGFTDIFEMRRISVDDLIKKNKNIVL
jgi:hypothetical protein